MTVGSFVYQFAGRLWGITWYRTNTFKRRCWQCGKSSGDIGYMGQVTAKFDLPTLCDECWVAVKRT